MRLFWALRPQMVVLAGALLAAACGVKGDPEIASDRQDAYPRVYPEGALPPDPRPPNIYRIRSWDEYYRPGVGWHVE